MHYSCCKILIGCLVLQVAVDATVYVCVPSFNQFGISYVPVATFSNRDATIMDSSVEGQLEYAAPSDACSPIAHPFFVKTNDKSNMVLINGTDKCDFMTKIKNARAAGFEAAILFDPFAEPFNYSNITFPIERSEINVTVVLVSFEDGIKLQNYLFPESRKASSFVQILPSYAYQIELYILYGLGGVFGALVISLVVGLLVLAVQNRLENYRNRVPDRVMVASWNIPVSEVSESAHLLASESSAPNNRPHSTETLKNELVEALGSVNNVYGSELKRENTQTVIV